MGESGEKTFFVDRKGKITRESPNETPDEKKRREEREWYIALFVRTKRITEEAAEKEYDDEEKERLFKFDIETLEKIVENEPHNDMIAEILKEKKALAASKWGKKQKTS